MVLALFWSNSRAILWCYSGATLVQFSCHFRGILAHSGAHLCVFVGTVYYYLHAVVFCIVLSRRDLQLYPSVIYNVAPLLYCAPPPRP